MRKFAYTIPLCVAVAPLYLACSQGANDVGTSQQAVSKSGVRLDANSDAELAKLSPTLATGTFVYTLQSMTKSSPTLESDGTTTVGILVAASGELRITRGNRAAFADARGHFRSSTDPSVSPLFTVPLQLPPQTAARGATWQQDGLPYTAQDLANANANGATSESSVVTSQTLGVGTVDATHKLLLMKRTSFAFVLPTTATAAIAPRFEAAGYFDFSSGQQAQIRTIYDYWLVNTSTERALKLGEASVLFDRFSPPSSAASMFSGGYAGDYVVMLSKLEASASTLPADLAPAVNAAMGMLPSQTTLWFDESAPDGALMYPTAPSCQ